jgi:hypothetical protein
VVPRIVFYFQKNKKKLLFSEENMFGKLIPRAKQNKDIKIKNKKNKKKKERKKKKEKKNTIFN